VQRSLHNEELYHLYSSPDTYWVIKLRRMKWAGHVACMWTGKVHTGFWWGEPDRRRVLGKLRRGWENNIKMNLQEVVWGGMD
jgi:hypothetical protein